MKQTTIDKAVKVFNRSIKFYWRTINRQRSNTKVKSFRNYVANLERYQIILADLITIRKAIQKNETEMVIYGTAESRSYVYNETLRVICKAGFDYDGDGFTGEIRLFSNEEFEEEFQQEIEEGLANGTIYLLSDEEAEEKFQRDSEYLNEEYRW